VITQPGLNSKWPLIDQVVYIDKRVLDLEAPVQEVIAADQKRLIVDAFARYRIHNPLKFYQTVNSIEGANSRLSTLIISSLRRVLGESSFIKVVRDERPLLTGRMREQVDREAAGMGISVVD
jgi:membrane protease subunit HflC